MLDVTGEVGATYLIESSTNLGKEPWITRGWIDMATAAAKWTDPMPVNPAQRYYRVVKVTRPAVQTVANMVWIPAGTFVMGSPPSEYNRNADEGPLTTVMISKDYWLGEYEVTQREYLALMGANPSWFSGDLDRPAEQVSWDDAAAYCEKLTAQERAAGRLADGYEYRLPTEAQWEYACRAGTCSRFSFGDALECDNRCAVRPRVAHLHMYWCVNAADATHHVGQKLPNPWGFHDMHGNVSEWCADFWADSLDGGSVTDPQGHDSGSLRVCRGGGWPDYSQYCRSAFRGKTPPEQKANHIGFRVALASVGGPSDGKVLVPAGLFQMGDTYLEGDPAERPVHSVYLSAFYMDKYEVTKDLWDAIYSWAIAHGYEFDNRGFAGGPEYPVESISWHDAVKWANARSEAAGLTPCYYTTPSKSVVYKKGRVDVSNDAVRWDADGFRLPTEAEWEKAARGELVGHHYPWPSFGGGYSDHIDCRKANYDSCKYHVTPVGYYDGHQIPGGGTDMANGFGLYDMTGNVSEWCWDWMYESWYGQAGAVVNNTRGPVSGFLRVIRGGGWLDESIDCRVAKRGWFEPSDAAVGLGFRLVRGRL